MNSQDRSTAASQLFDRFLAQRLAPSTIGFDAFVADHPEHADLLRDRMAAWLELEAVRARALADTPRGRARTQTDRLLAKLAVHSARGARYEQRGQLGKGGMGVVREVWDGDLRRTLAMKLVREDLLDATTETEAAENDHVLQRFLEEAQVTAQLGHPGVVPVHEIGVDGDGRPFFTMTRVEGEDLGRVFARSREPNSEWSSARVLGVLERVCQTMAFAHSRGVLHRDLKPSNVMVGAYGEVYVMDWGLARVGSDEREGVVTTDRRLQIAEDPATPLASLGLRQPGTVYYMAPEQAADRASEVGPRSDVYAVGAMLYEFLARRVPYRGDGDELSPADVRERVVLGPPERIEALAPDAPAELVAICNKAMARAPADRYADMLAMAADLRAYLEGRVVRAHRTGAWVELSKWIRRNRGTAAAISVALVLLVGSSALVASQNRTLASTNEDLRVQTEKANEASEAARRNAVEAVAQGQLAEQRRAEASLRSARLAGERGRWIEALHALEDARAAGFPDPLELGIEEARARIAIADGVRAAAIVDELLARDDVGARRGTLLLMRADLMMSDEEEQERALALVRQALDAGVGPADANFAQALLAESAPEALDWLDKTLALDPFHSRALCYAPMLLFFLGRLDEAFTRAEIQTSFFPEDPNPRVVQACVLALRGLAEAARGKLAEIEARVPEAAFANAEAVVGALSTLEAETRDIGHWIGGQRAGFDPRAKGALLLKATVGKWSGSRAGGEELASIEFFDPNLPVLRRGTRVWLNTVRNAVYGFLRDSESLERELERALEVLPEGSLHYFRAGMLMDVAQKSPMPTMIDYLRLAEAEYRRAYETPSLVPGVARAARHWAACAELMLAYTPQGKDSAMAARGYANIDWLLMRDDMIAFQCASLIHWIRTFAHDSAVGERLAARWEQLAPDDEGMLAARAQLALDAGAPVRALGFADRWVLVSGAKPAACEFREQLLVTLSSLASGAGVVR
jgi:serine/threonine protein kinase